MALVKGTNCGFVTVAPVADPAGANTLTIDDRAYGLKDVAPAGVARVTEIGWWCDTATEAADFDVAIYSHDAVNNRPDAFVGSAINNAKGLAAGWKVVSGLNIAITPGTTYWIGVQVDNTATATFSDATSTVGEKIDYKISQSALPNPWGASSGSGTYLCAFYALYETASPAVVSKFGNLLNSEKIEQKIGMFAGI
jgi:hypothetical protein